MRRCSSFVVLFLVSALFCFVCFVEWSGGEDGGEKATKEEKKRKHTKPRCGGKTPQGVAEKMQILDHNLKAYKALIKSFKKANRACIVYPTGLGKSYIAYQLIADNPDSTFLVLLV